jgi:nucleoside-diphosphate-sugar epimerase
LTPDLHVIFGAGQVGRPLAERLLAAGKRVRIARRSSAPVPAGCEVVFGDAAERSFCVESARDATTLYHCLNPPYDHRVWARLVPRYMDNLIAAAAAARARLVVLDNLYMLGKPKGRAFNEDTPHEPCSRKGEIRARAAERLFEAHRTGEVVATAGRASDFYGPGGTQTALGDFFWPRALSRKTAYSPYSLDSIHTYHYIPDVAAGLSLLGSADSDVYGKPWMLPCAPAITLRELVARMQAKLGSSIKVAQMPRWLLKTIGVVMPIMRELDEMAYQWEEPFVVDDRRFRERFHALPEDTDDAAAATVTWAKQRYAPKERTEA